MSRLVGRKAPEFSAEACINGEFQDISLADYPGKWKILFFYPLDFTFVCPSEIVAFSEAAAQFKQANCEIFACSVDSVYSHLAWTKQSRKEGGLGKINYPLISDTKRTLSHSYDVITDEGIALRGLFLIDDHNVIQHATINNLSVGRNVEETFRLLKAYQLTAENGEVCPANWNVGKDTMKPDPSGSKEWFQNNN